MKTANKRLTRSRMRIGFRFDYQQIGLLCLIVWLFAGLSGKALAEMTAKTHAVKHQTAQQSMLPACQGLGALPSVHCGRTPSIAMDANGKAYVVFSQNGHVYLSTSMDQGQSYSSPVAVNARPEAIYDDGENRPKIVLDGLQRIYVTWTHKTPGRYSGDVRFARSLDGGEHFSEPLTLNADKQLISHRFDSMALDDAGRLYVFWIDKRDQQRAVKTAQDYLGAAIYVTYSDDQGASFREDKKWVDHSCECCRIASAKDTRGSIALLWRHVFPGNIRDHAIAYLDAKASTTAQPAKPLKATFDDWQLEGCPHQGPDLSFDEDNLAHMVWFTQGKRYKGLVYGQYDFTKQAPQRVKSVDSSPAASRAQVQVFNGEVFIVWKRFNGEAVELRLLRSSDAGQTWMQERQIASTAHDSDHPDFIRYGNKLYVTWHTQAEGLRWMELNQ